IQRVNKNFLDLYGVTNNDVVGRKCHEACFGLKDVCDGCLVKRALASKKTEKKIKSFPTGEICEMTAQPVLNEQGEVTHVLDMRTNITELVEKERELQRIQFAMNQSTDEFWLFDKNWQVVYASSSVSNNLGYPVYELKGAHIEKFNLLHRLENLPTLFERLRKKKNMRIESVQYKQDGSTYPCEMNLSYFADTDEYVYAVVRNISKRKKYENELIESREQAERASKLKSVFLANMSHEIRTPMNAIIGFSNFIMEEELDEATKQELKTEIRTNSDYLLSIISDIMEISQIESGNRKAQFADINVSSLLENIYQEQNRKCPAGISLSIHKGFPADLSIHSDANLIKQLFDRLISNAVKFTGKGEVEMGCDWNAAKKQAEFYVKDDGIGIQSQHLEEIFEPFHQLNSMMKGIGIGLTICRAHAELLKTKIQAQSNPGKGSTFSFRLKIEG
ncbi:MAG: PAS domain-containing sensor histidine kinase, partial [Prolixibacteraceae bacterium]|nr:PAS domain-containing sensor histidine kinase [Prolixibacteraceae bacterium]